MTVFESKRTTTKHIRRPGYPPSEIQPARTAPDGGLVFEPCANRSLETRISPVLEDSTTDKQTRIKHVGTISIACDSNETRNQSALRDECNHSRTASWIRKNLPSKPSAEYGISRTILRSAQGASLTQGGSACVILNP